MYRILCSLFLIAGGLAAQMNGVYSIHPLVPASATNFTTIGSAVAALEAQGVSGPVIFQIYDDAGPYTEANTVVTFINAGTAVLSVRGHLVVGITSTNTVTFEAAPGEFPVFDAVGQNYGVKLHGTQYVTVKGIEIMNAIADGVSIYTDAVTTPVGFVGNLFGNAVIGCRIHDIGGCGINVYQNGGAAIAFESTVIRNNFIWRCQVTHGGGNATWRNGYINERRSRMAIIENNSLYADTGVGTNFCVFTTWYAAGIGGPAQSFRNNVIMKTIANGAIINHIEAGGHPLLQDNNVYEDLSGGLFLMGASGTAATFAAFQTAFPALDPNGLSGTVNFVNAANGDLHLGAGSAAIDVGVAIAAITDDIDGDPRPGGSAYDAGADEAGTTGAQVIAYGTGCMGTNGVPVLSAPQAPFLGNFTFSLLVDQAAINSVAYIFVALAPSSTGLPVGGGCTVWLDFNSLVTLVNIGFSPLGPFGISGTGSGALALPVPNDPALSGASLYFQAAVVDTTPIGLALSNGLQAVIL